MNAVIAEIHKVPRCYTVLPFRIYFLMIVSLVILLCCAIFPGDISDVPFRLGWSWSFYLYILISKYVFAVRAHCMFVDSFFRRNDYMFVKEMADDLFDDPEKK